MTLCRKRSASHTRPDRAPAPVAPLRADSPNTRLTPTPDPLLGACDQGFQSSRETSTCPRAPRNVRLAALRIPSGDNGNVCSMIGPTVTHRSDALPADYPQFLAEIKALLA